MARSMNVFFFFSITLALISPAAVRARPDKEMMQRFYGNLTMDPMAHNSTGDGSIADMFDRVLQKEFSENDVPEGWVFFFYD